MRRGPWLRLLTAASIVGLPVASAPGSVSAAVGVSVFAKIRTPTAVGEVAVASINISNVGSDPITVAQIAFTPSCGSGVTCTDPDPGVYTMNGPFNGTGTPGSACPTSYDVTVVDAMPTLDAAFAHAGMQTRNFLDVVASDDLGNFGVASGSNVTTVTQATPTLTTQATPQLATGFQEFRDIATVAGPTGAAAPTGTMTFRLFGPLPAGPPTCGVADRSAGGVPLVATGPSTSTADSGAFVAPPGNYAWVATYSGDANYLPVTGVCGDPADLLTVVPAPPPVISVTNTPDATTAPEPGDAFSFEVVVTNEGSTPVTITELMDDVYGNVAFQGTCGDAVGTVLVTDATYTCHYGRDFLGAPGDEQTNVLTATAVDTSATFVSASVATTLRITDAFPTLAVSLAPSPATREEPGGTFFFRVEILNTSVEDVTIRGFRYERDGNEVFDPSSDCAVLVGTVLRPGEWATCTYSGEFFGGARQSQLNVVHVEVMDDEQNIRSRSAAAFPMLTDVAPDVFANLSSSMPDLGEPGGPTFFEASVYNGGLEAFWIEGLVDSLHGDLAAKGTCTDAVGTLIQPGVTYRCEYSGSFFGEVGDTQTNTLTVDVVDDDANRVAASASTTTVIADLAPSVVVDLDTPISFLAEPGGTYTFVLVVTNTSAEPVTISALDDDVYGDLSNRGTCALGATLQVDATYSCTFDGDFIGDAWDAQQNVVTVTVVDDEGNSESGSADGFVEIFDVAPTVRIRTTVAPGSVEPGGSVTFGVVVTNTSIEPVTITQLWDDVYGDLASRGTCTTAVGTVLAIDAAYSCSFSGSVAGAAGETRTNVTEAFVSDDEGSVGWAGVETAVTIVAAATTTSTTSTTTTTTTTAPLVPAETTVPSSTAGSDTTTTPTDATVPLDGRAGPTISGSSANPLAGGMLTVTVGNLCANAAATFIQTGPTGTTSLGTVTTDSSGSASVNTITPVVGGRYTVTASTAVGGCNLNAAFTYAVDAQGPFVPGDLPLTGGSISTGLVLGLLLLAGGALMVTATRRRHGRVAGR